MARDSKKYQKLEEDLRGVIGSVPIQFCVYRIPFEKLNGDVLISIGNDDRPADQLDLDSAQEQMNCFRQSVDAKFIVQKHDKKRGKRISKLWKKFESFPKYSLFVASFKPEDVDDHMIMARIGTEKYPATAAMIDYVSRFTFEMLEICNIEKISSFVVTHHSFDFYYPPKV